MRPRLKLHHASIVLSAILLFSCGGKSDLEISKPVQKPPSTIPGPRPDFGPRDYVLFESGQVRPLAISNDGQQLYATNTPDNRLEIFTISDDSILHQHSVNVGLEPVAVAVAPNGNVWVVNHLSDSISIIDVASTIPHVINTLLVGDEPQDIVFAGSEKQRAFISTAHRGQNSPIDPQLTTPSVGRADIWVFDPSKITYSSAHSASQIDAIITLFGDKPRGLAVSADKSRVYASIFKSGNQTTSIAPSNIRKGLPIADSDNVEQPDSGVILQFNGKQWLDDQGADFSASVPFSLPDYDVFEINADDTMPKQTRRWSGVGTTIFNLAVNPANQKIYASNLNANNHTRFAGQGLNSTTVNGHLADNRITIIDNESVLPRHLNKHLSFQSPQGTENDRQLSLSMPQQMQFSADGLQLFVTAFGSQKVAVLQSKTLENDSFNPDSNNHIELSAGGPTGLVVDALRNKLYVMTRFDNGISTIDIATKMEVDHLTMFNPEPDSVVKGRVFQYDARLTSGKGNDSCGTCHLFADTDGLAWDLGDPAGKVKNNPNAFIAISNPAPPNNFHSMKGPMLTQSMRGLTGHGPMHWRGDRTGDNRVNDETLEEAAFKEFNEAFVGLLGRDEELTPEQMQLFTDYAMQVTYPPNPIRALNNQLNPTEAAGFKIFKEGVVRIQTGELEVCAQCHTLDEANGHFGTLGLMSDNGQSGERNFKIPHFRDQYQKVGSFGWGFESPPATGPQVRGFGWNHNGSTSGNFVIADLGMSAEPLAQIRAFLFAFPTEQAPIVGQQITLSPISDDSVHERISLLVERALVTVPVPECDLVAKGIINKQARGFVMNSDGKFISDVATDAPFALEELVELAIEDDNAMTFTCTQWGSGRRIGIDRDGDNILDGDEKY